MGIDGRGLVIVTCLCGVIFTCFFAIGRAVSPGSPPREAALPGISVAAGGPAIPVRLSSVSPLEIGVAATSRPVRRRNVQVSAANPAASAPESTSTTSAAQARQSEASRSSSPVAPQPASPATPTSPQEHSKSAPGAGKSFDSSG
jgi:hypothetical protein